MKIIFWPVLLYKNSGQSLKSGGEQIKQPEQKLFACYLHKSSIWKSLGIALEQTEKTNQGKEEAYLTQKKKL